MSHNSAGSYAISQKAFWRAYDDLPRAARDALKEAAADWVPTSWSRPWKAGKATPSELVADIKRADANEYAKLERQRARAIGPYKGNIPDRAIAHMANERRRRA